MIRKPEDRARWLANAGPDAFVSAELFGPRHPLNVLKRRLVGVQVTLALASIAASVVLYTVTGVEVALQEAGPLTRDMYAFVGVLVPAGHAGLAFLLISGVKNAGSYAARGAWLMVLVHLAWGSGIAVGHWPALPVGLVLVAGDLLFLFWLRGVRESLDAGVRAPAGLGR